jgi:hypothetical protein
MALAEEASSGMLATPLPRGSYGEVARRRQLRRLDQLLGELESLNLGGMRAVPAGLSERLRAAGVGHPSDANITHVIDLLFRTQERYLAAIPATHTRGRSAA